MSKNRKKKSRAPRIIRNIIWLLLVVLLSVCGYFYFHAVFADQAMASSGNGVEVTVRIDPDMTDLQVGKKLKNNGLIENEYVFVGQAKILIDSGSSIQPGTYILNTEMNAGQILNVLSAEETAEE